MLVNLSVSLVDIVSTTSVHELTLQLQILDVLIFAPRSCGVLAFL